AGHVAPDHGRRRSAPVLAARCLGLSTGPFDNVAAGPEGVHDRSVCHGAVRTALSQTRAERRCVHCRELLGSHKNSSRSVREPITPDRDVPHPDPAAVPLRAAILETNPTGGPLHVFASGLRNPVSLAVDPGSGDIWTTVNERDLLGNNLPPDYVTRVRRGGFYGWPWFYAGSNEDPTLPGRHPELKYQSIVPDVLLQPHSAPIQ